MKTIFRLSILILLFLSCKQHVNAFHDNKAFLYEDSITVTGDSISNVKKRKVTKCLFQASIGLHNVVVDHSQEAALVIGKSPKSKEELVYQNNSKIPKDYIEFFQKELFTQICWKKIESKLRKKYHKEVFESMLVSQKKLTPELAKGDKKNQIEKYLEEFAYIIVDRFYLPNYKAIFIDNLYYEWEVKGGNPVIIKDYIKKEDLPLVIEALEGK